MKTLAIFLALTSTSMAGLVVDFDNSNPYSVPEVLQFETTGATMDGMVVTGWFSNGSSSTGIWGATGSRSGQASASGWLLTQRDDTWSTQPGDAWKLTGRDLVGISIDAGIGGVVFDRVLNPFVSPGSANGRQFRIAPGSNYQGDIVATYSNPVLVQGQGYDPHDLYAKLHLQFDEPLGNKRLAFFADTDNIPASVPEPSSGALALIGCSLLPFRRRR